MRILVANNQLQNTGGTENYTYAIIVELLRLGHNVEYFTFIKGEVSDRIEQLGVRFMSKESYDLILANHNNVIKELYQYGYIIQTCHGIYPELEQPSIYADSHVSISYEVQQYLNKKGFPNTLIYNGIDCNRFYPKRQTHDKLTSVLSLCQSETANNFISNCCSELGITFKKLNKHIDNEWHIENIINEADLVVGIGRSLYDAMACGRAVISYDNRNYSKDYGDGYLTSENINESIMYNCSGRGLKKVFDKDSFITELMKYNRADAEFLRHFALENLNISLSVSKYLSIAAISSPERDKVKLDKAERIIKILERLTDEQDEQLKIQNKDIYNISKSMDFQLGHFLLKPLRTIKKFISK